MVDKKEKKRIVVLRERLKKLQQMLAGVKQQCDDPREAEEVEQQIAKTKSELDLIVGK
jgi:DNA-binding FrmR family transcriptional regulator